MGKPRARHTIPNTGNPHLHRVRPADRVGRCQSSDREDQGCRGRRSPEWSRAGPSARASHPASPRHEEPEARPRLIDRPPCKLPGARHEQARTSRGLAAACKPTGV